MGLARDRASSFKGVTPRSNWLQECIPKHVGTVSMHDLDRELLERIEEISLLCERVEQGVTDLIQRYGTRNETVASAKALHTSVTALKRELLQHYLEFRIADAARISGVPMS